jgi:hypothetical protein
MREITMNDLCDKLNNYFEREIHAGTFTVENGSISLPFLLNGQYFRIVGSVLNDGVYKYPCSELTDESFRGEVWAMGPPPALIALLAEINEWQTKYGETVQSPYDSESFAGYSYSKAKDSKTGNAVTWDVAFRSQLSRWRKI